jgi:urease accessory protein
MGRPMPVTGAMALVGVFAIFHGHAHGAEMPIDASGLDYAAGFIAATSLLHLAGVAGTFGAAKLVGKYGRIIAQIAGGAFALTGLSVLGGWL